MNKFRFTIKLLVIATFLLAFASIAQAQATRTWVSGVGDDANPCSRTAPCKTFAGAISKTATGGEINVLDPGGFGGVTITKSITISSEGFEAGVLVSGTNAIIINAGANSVITLRGLDIEGLGTGLSGIKVLAGVGLPVTVNVEDCTIEKFTQGGINVAASADVKLNVRNCIIRNNASDGLIATTSAGQVRATLINSSFTGNTNGLHAEGGSRVTADHCNFANNTQNGVFAEGVGGVAVADITNSAIMKNGTNGVQAATGGSVARINNCDIFGNTGTGALVGAGGEIDTWGNNRIFSNGTDGCSLCTPKGFN